MNLENLNLENLNLENLNLVDLNAQEKKKLREDGLIGLLVH